MSVLSFLRKKGPAQPPEQPGKHYGLFSVSAGDIIISRPLYDLTIQHLRSSPPAAQQDFAKQLEDLVKGMW